MRARLNLPPESDGSLWRYATAVAANRQHHHAELELNLVTAGRGTYLLGGMRYEVRRGDMLWLFPAQEHVLAEHTPNFAMWVAVFRRRALRRIATDAKTRPLQMLSFSGEACRRLASGDVSRFEELFNELSSEAGECALLNAGLGYVLLRAWDAFQRAGGTPARQLHPSVERAAHLLRDDETTTALPMLARQTGLSPSRLSRLFKEQTGTSLVDFRNRQRLKRFLSLYQEGRRPTLLDAAYEAGFGSYPQFHRVFRKHMGCSPVDYVSKT